MNTRRPPSAPEPRRRPPQSVGRGTKRSGLDPRWLPAIGAAVVLLVVIIAGTSGGGGASSDGSADGATVLVPGSGDTGDSQLTVPVSTGPAVATSTVPEAEKIPLAAPFTFGASGTDVKMVQQRLADLGFQPGPVDGYYGSGTQQAIWAYKKLLTMSSYLDLVRRDDASVVTPELWSQMQDDIVIAPRRRGAGTHAEVYLPLQVMVVFADNRPEFIAHISSGELNDDGTPKQWCELLTYDTDNQGRPLDEPVTRDECALAKTPGGVFRFTRRYDGKRIGPLGGMYNPVYFNYGIAVHGAKNVPKEPASHGCIRISNDLAEVFPSLVKKGDLIYVWGHDGKEPEQYSKRESLPDFNKPNPNSTSTTSTSTTTTVPTTTTTKPAPTTTAKPVVTTTPAATTTTTTTPGP